MIGRTSLGVLSVSGVAMLLGSLAACAAPVDEPTAGAASKVTQRTFDRNAVLDDTSMRDGDAMTVADVQKFLDKTPWGTRSVLAKYTENGKSAAAIMVDSATSHGINPLEMLVRVQMEQGLISKTTASTATISIAFGCGCPHSAVCNDSYRGFANQANCAAGTLSRSMTRALTSSGTVSGWARNKTKATQDGLSIVPKNAATAALYTYTPWVGEAGGGMQGVGGVSLHAAVWDRFAEATSYGAWATQTATNAADDAGSSDPDDEEDPMGPGNGGEPTADAGTATPDTGTDSGTGTSTDADAGAPEGDVPAGETGGNGAPEDGSEDDAILGEGNAPPASNAPPPKTRSNSNDNSSSTTPSRPEELPEASEDELASKPKAGAGCSTTGGNGGSTNGLLLAGAVALVVSRRRRSR